MANKSNVVTFVRDYYPHVLGDVVDLAEDAIKRIEDEVKKIEAELPFVKGEKAVDRSQVPVAANEQVPAVATTSVYKGDAPRTSEGVDSHVGVDPNPGADSKAPGSKVTDVPTPAALAAPTTATEATAGEATATTASVEPGKATNDPTAKTTATK
jgi:hypothetical protein